MTSVEASLHKKFDLVWSDSMLVGNDFIDHTHREFVDVVNALWHCRSSTAVSCLKNMHTHAQKHFQDEENLMKATQYPSTDCHAEEHHKVLVAIELVLDHYNAKRIQVGEVHRLAKTMINWFPGHIDYLDSAVSAWVSKQRFAGAPVVLRRNVLA